MPLPPQSRSQLLTPQAVMVSDPLESVQVLLSLLPNAGPLLSYPTRLQPTKACVSGGGGVVMAQAVPLPIPVHTFYLWRVGWNMSANKIPDQAPVQKLIFSTDIGLFCFSGKRIFRRTLFLPPQKGQKSFLL